MNHTDHVGLIRAGVLRPGGVWADLGAGAGAFTLALADLLGPGAEIYAVDQDPNVLQTQAGPMAGRFSQTIVYYVTADFTQPLNLPLLDGVVMANALHFQPVNRQEAVVRQVKSYLRPGGRLILVEYNTDQGNTWVPYPLSYPTWENLAQRAGFSQTRRLAAVPSRFWREIYAAVSS